MNYIRIRLAQFVFNRYERAPSAQADLAFVTGLLFASVVLFYLVFIFAPRQIAFPNGSARDWLVRFGLFVVGLVFNIGILQF